MNATGSANSVSDSLGGFETYWFTVWMRGNAVCECAALLGPVIALSTIVIMCMTKEGVAKSARVYYVALAFADLIALTGFHLFVFYLDDDFRYMSDNTVYVAIEGTILCASTCKRPPISRTMLITGCMWCYVQSV